MLDDYTRSRVIDAVEAWVERHPRPDSAVLEVAQRLAEHQSGSYSPRQILAELRTADRSFIWQMIESGIEDYSLDDVVRGFRGESASPLSTA